MSSPLQALGSLNDRALDIAASAPFFMPKRPDGACNVHVAAAATLIWLKPLSGRKAKVLHDENFAVREMKRRRSTERAGLPR